MVYVLVELMIIVVRIRKDERSIFMQNRKFKKLSTFIAVTMLSVATVGTTAFASPQMLFDSEEGIGIEVHCSNPNAIHVVFP